MTDQATSLSPSNAEDARRAAGDWSWASRPPTRLEPRWRVRHRHGRRPGRALRRAAGRIGIRPGARWAGLGSSAPQVARWLGDIRTYFPTSVVQVMQRDAIERLQLTSMLLEPELLTAIQPDVHLVSTLVGLNRVMPETTRATARAVVQAVVREIERRVAQQTRSAVTGAVNRAAKTRRPRRSDIDWAATIGRNLDHYLPEYQTVVPERLVGYRPQRPRLRRRRDRGHRPVGLDGRVRGLRGGLRRRAGLHQLGPDLAGGFRHRGGRPVGAARRPRRRLVRLPTRRRDRHQPGGRLLRRAGHPADRDGVRPDLRSVRGRHRGGPAPRG